MRPGRQTLVLAAMLFTVSMTFIDQTIVAIAAPDIIDELNLTASGMQWVVNAYLLALAAFFAFGGRLADLLGPRRVALGGTIVFVVASALCGAVPKGSGALAWLITCRAIQGFGAALLFPAALAVVVAVFPVERRGRALALFFGISGALTAIGPILGGWLTTWTWRAIFWVNVPVAVIAVTLTLMAKLRDRPRREAMDWRGAALVALGMGGAVLGLQQSTTWGWGDWKTWVCIVGGLAVLAVFCRVELATRHPLIKLRVFRDRAFAVDNGVLFFAMMAFVPLFFFASVYGQVCLSMSPSEAGSYLFIFFAGFAIASQLGGRILDRNGARPAMLLGTALGAVGFALWAGRLTDLSLSRQWWFVVMAGAGIGFLLAPASTDAVNRAIDASYGEVTGITQTVRNFSAAIGLAVFGTVLSHVTTDRIISSFQARGIPPSVSHSVAHQISQSISGRGNASAPTGNGPAATFARGAMATVRNDFAQGNQAVFYGMAAALAVAFLVALWHPGTRVTQEEPAVVPGAMPPAATGVDGQSSRS
ncbi:MFS transporter [Streptantibioticus parmotrematis]|nr:MFS transporter [Streptantibioticus parmotrematis]